MVEMYGYNTIGLSTVIQFQLSTVCVYGVAYCI